MYEKDRRLSMILPGGELETGIEDFLRAVGLVFEFGKVKTDNGIGKVLFAAVENIPIDFTIMRASSIPELLDDPKCNAKAGITGSDILWESGWGKDAGEELDVKKFTSKIPDSSLFIGFNARFLQETRRNNGRPATLQDLPGGMIATKYPNIAKDYFEGKKVNEVEIQYFPGKDESAQFLYKSNRGTLGIWSTGKTALANGITPYDIFYNVTTRLVQAKSVKMQAWELSLLNDFKETCYVAQQRRR